MADAGDDEKSTMLGSMWRYAGVGGGVAGVEPRLPFGDADDRWPHCHAMPPCRP
jgi:hypothetical protein